MQNINVNIEEPYSSFVVDGQKMVEGRLNRGKFSELNSGDFIEMNDERIIFEVIAKNNYMTFREMLETEGITKVLPDKFTLEQGVNVYRKFYTPEEEAEFGVVAIRIKPCKSNK